MGNWRRSPFVERMSATFLKPPKPGSSSAARAAAAAPRSVEEIEADVRSASDKERLIGLLAAPIAAAVGILVISALIDNDPAAKLADGLANKLHTSVSTYYELLAVLAGLSILMLATSLLRKRLYLGMVAALYGLTIFNLHYWGFGIPYIMLAAWLLVRSYRLQRDLREARHEESSWPGAASARRYAATATASRPGANRRYTPPRSARGPAALPRTTSKNRAR
jgi:hypothetical protein